jgi:hypothetical protein
MSDSDSQYAGFRLPLRLETAQNTIVSSNWRLRSPNYQAYSTSGQAWRLMSLCENSANRAQLHPTACLRASCNRELDGNPGLLATVGINASMAVPLRIADREYGGW